MSPIQPGDRGYQAGALRVHTDNDHIVVEAPATGDESPRLTGWQALDLALALAGRAQDLLRNELAEISEDADSSAMQAGFWRERAKELGASEDDMPTTMKRGGP